MEFISEQQRITQELPPFFRQLRFLERLHFGIFFLTLSMSRVVWRSNYRGSGAREVSDQVAPYNVRECIYVSRALLWDFPNGYMDPEMALAAYYASLSQAFLTYKSLYSQRATECEVMCVTCDFPLAICQGLLSSCETTFLSYSASVTILPERKTV